MISRLLKHPFINLHFIETTICLLDTVHDQGSRFSELIEIILIRLEGMDASQEFHEEKFHIKTGEAFVFLFILESDYHREHKQHGQNDW